VLTAAAEPLRANVVSMSPNDIDQPDVPVSIVFQLYKPELPSPRWGKPIGGVNAGRCWLRPLRGAVGRRRAHGGGTA
jgi:hypothetical protein